MKCPKCNSELNTNSQFCGNCGNSIQKSLKTNNKKNKTGNLTVAYILLGLLIILCTVVIVIMFFNKTQNKKSESIANSNSFFISDKNENYAIFDVDGNKLTDFEFTRYSYGFVNGATEVENKKGEEGIVSSSGKMVVDFGKYEYINKNGSLYEVTTKEGNEILLNASGKNLGSMENSYLHTYISDSTYYYSILETDKEYKLLNYNGDIITTFNKIEGTDEPRVSNDDPYISIFYNQKSYIINLETEKVILTFDNKKHFCINNVNLENNKELTLNTCVGSFETQDTVEFKFINDGKSIFEKTDSDCKNIYFDAGNNLICHQDFSEQYILDKTNGEKKFNISSYSSPRYAYKNLNNYIVDKDNTNKIDFYKDGKLVKTVNGRIVENEYTEQEIYLVEYHESLLGNNQYYFYNSDGALLNNEFYSRAENFDEHGIAIVYKNKYYLINKKGEKVSKEYSSVRSQAYVSSPVYIATDSNNNEILINKDGEELCLGKSINLEDRLDTTFAKITTNEGEYILYNTKTKKEIIKTKSNMQLHNQYLTIEEDNKTKYYTYSGKLFLEL